MCTGYKTNVCMEHLSKESRMIEFLFTTLQYLYNFLTRTTNRFDIYLDKVEELQEGIVVKNLPVTRWTGHLESGDHADWKFEIVIKFCVLEELSGMVTTDCQTTASELFQDCLRT